MEKGSRGTILAMFFIILVMVGVLGFIGYSLYQLARTSDEGLFSGRNTLFYNENDAVSEPKIYIPNDNFSYDFDVVEYANARSTDQDYNYNFAVSKADGYGDYTSVETGVADLGLIEEVQEIQQEIESVNFGNLSEVQIPSIGVKSPILQGSNGDELLDHGWWLYPASYTDVEGEKILYCHRRYFGRFDPRTCWNLNQIIEGDEIYLFNSNGEKFVYKVISTSVVHQSVSNLMRPSTKNYVKIITCGTANGAPGGNDYRVVVLGELE